MRNLLSLFHLSSPSGLRVPYLCLAMPPMLLNTFFPISSTPFCPLFIQFYFIFPSLLFNFLRCILSLTIINCRPVRHKR
ncbi:hypothetical protein VTL71DRAFT_458 [Oculimacula yallundae]|uniref:Uncharacterized protein n=1 Tax=Oculimacula yallundae TaxID=86028 RepID=A0ABR4D080_9HELO